MSNLTDKWKDFQKKAIETGKAVKEWALQNKKVSVPAAAAVIVVILVAVSAFAGSRDQQIEAGASVESGTELASIPVPEVPLEENAHAEINKLISAYYSAMAGGNIDELLTMTNYIDETEKIRIEKKSRYIEKYDNIVCYTKVGLVEDSYLVYVYYEAKFYDIETPAPALKTCLVYRNEQGEYYIYEGELDDNVSDYLQELSAQDDVTNLCNTVQAKYNEAVAADEALKTFMSDFPELIKKEVGEALAALEAAETEETEETETQAGETEESGAEEEPSEVREVETTDTVNVRSSDSETADKLGKVDKGTKLPLLEKKENGWSKVQYNGAEAYIKSEFLADVVNTDTSGESEEASGDGEQNVQPEESQTSQGGGGLIGKDGKVTATTTVNVRAAADENSERLGTIYQGEKLELVMQQADGWCKVKYNGKTGYVKTEFME